MRTINKLAVLAVLTFMIAVNAEAKIRMQGQISRNEQKMDIRSVHLEVYDNYLSRKATPPRTIICPVNAKGEFSVSFEPPNRLFYMSLVFTNSNKDEVLPLEFRLTNRLLLYENDDSLCVDVNVRDRWLTFDGRGAEKLNCQFQMASVSTPESGIRRLSELSNSGKNDEYLEFWGNMNASQWLNQQKILESYPSLTKEIKDRIYMDIQFEQEYFNFKMLNFNQSSGIPGKSDAVNKYFNKHYINDIQPPVGVDSSNMSSRYYQYLYRLNWLRLQFELFPNGAIGKRLPMETFYQLIRRRYTGQILNNLLTLFFTESDKQQSDALPYINNVLADLPTGEPKRILTEWHERFTKMKQQNFTLTDSTGKKITLNDFKGKVLVLDFWFNGCQGCLEMVPSIEKLIAHYKDVKDVTFISVSTDNLKQFQAALKLGSYTSPGQILLYTSGMVRQHPILNYLGINIYPTLIIIGKNGNVISSRAPNPRIDDGAAMKRLIDAAL